MGWVGGWVNIRCCGNGRLGFRPYGDSLFLQTPKKSKQKNACSYVRPARWGSGSLRSGLHPGAAPPVCFAAPPLAVFGCAKRSLRSHPRMNPSTQPADVASQIKIKSRRADTRPIEWCRARDSALVLWCSCPSSERRPPSPLPEGEGANFWAFQNWCSTRYFTSAHLSQTPRSVPSPSGRGLG